MAGDLTATTAGLKGLTVQSLGKYGTSTGAANLQTQVNGKLGFLTVEGSIFEAGIDVGGGSDGDIGPIKIGGSLFGGTTDGSGEIYASGDIGPVVITGKVLGWTGKYSAQISGGGNIAGVTIGGSLYGGKSDSSGEIYAGGNLGAVKVAGDVVGGDGQYSAEISGVNIASLTIGGSLVGGVGDSSSGAYAGGTLGAVKVAGDVAGGNGKYSGEIASEGKIASLSIGGSLKGGAGDSSGSVLAGGDIGPAAIGGDLVGGSASGDVNLRYSGCIRGQRIAKLTIDGSVIAGTDDTSGDFRSNGAILAWNDLGSVTVKGDIEGNSTNAVIISARGQAKPTAKADVAIGKLTVLGSVDHALILAGYTPDGAATNADAQVGAVFVGKDWSASSLAAGVTPGAFGLYGNFDDAKMTGNQIKDDAGVFSKIGSVTIGGQAQGNQNNWTCFGIVAENVVAVKVGGVPLLLKAGKSNDDVFVGMAGGNFKVHEV